MNVTPRRKNDAYYTPDDLAAKLVYLLSARMQTGCRVLEPSAGGGAFVRALLPYERVSTILAVDVDPDAPALYLPVTDKHYRAACQDFLDIPAIHPPHWVIGNPPFEDAEKHVRHALLMAKHGVAFLLRLAFLESVKREAFWEEHPCSDIVVLNKRPCFTGNGKTDSCAYGFFIWNTKYQTQQGRTHLHILSSTQRPLPVGATWGTV
jgi:hypothetical protein